MRWKTWSQNSYITRLVGPFMASQTARARAFAALMNEEAQ